MRLDVSDLRLFLMIVEAGSITHGAAAANLSTGAASERLKEMEAAVGVALLTRTRRGVSPTIAGETLVHHARIVLNQVGSMHAEMAEHTRAVRATVRLFVNSAAATEFVPERLGRWLAVNPGADLDLAERSSRETVGALMAGFGDLGIVSDAADTATLATDVFASDRLVAVVGRSHTLAGARRLGFADLLDREYVGFTGALREHVDEQAHRLGQRLRPRISFRTFEGVCQAAAQGAGFGIVPEIAARRCRQAMSISVIRITDRWASRRLLLCHRNDEALSETAKNLRHHLLHADHPSGERPKASKPGKDQTTI